MSKQIYAQAIIDDLAAGKDFSIPGVGKIKVVERAARQTRNPRTGEVISIPARKTAKLSVSSTLREKLNAA